MHFSSNALVKHYLPLCLACGLARSREGGAVPSGGKGSPKWNFICIPTAPLASYEGYNTQVQPGGLSPPQ